MAKNTKEVAALASKVCTTCWSELDIGEFHLKEASPDGRGNECKECRRDRQKEYYQLNKVAIGRRVKARKEEKKRQVAAKTNAAERAAQLIREDGRQAVRQLGSAKPDFFRGMGLAEIADCRIVTKADWIQAGAHYPNHLKFGSQS